MNQYLPPQPSFYQPPATLLPTATYPPPYFPPLPPSPTLATPQEYTCFLPPPPTCLPPVAPYSSAPAYHWRGPSVQQKPFTKYTGGWKNEYTCGTCHRSYKSEATYQEHIQSHVKCGQCDFTALPKLVRDHEQVHSIPDFLRTTTPEELSKWKEERRKNYPTVSTVAKKLQQEADRKERGQVANTPLYRYVNQLIGDGDRGRNGRGRGRGRGRGGRGRGRWSSRHQTNDRIQDDTTAACDSKKVSGLHRERSPRNETQESADNDCSRKRQFQRGRGRFRGSKRTRDNASKTIHDVVPKRPTLLEKLLAPEIRKENNAVLQCVRHVVRENFFGIGGEQSSHGTQLSPNNVNLSPGDKPD